MLVVPELKATALAIGPNPFILVWFSVSNSISSFHVSIRSEIPTITSCCRSGSTRQRATAQSVTGCLPEIGDLPTSGQMDGIGVFHLGLGASTLLFTYLLPTPPITLCMVYLLSRDTYHCNWRRGSDFTRKTHNLNVRERHLAEGSTGIALAFFFSR